MARRADNARSRIQRGAQSDLASGVDDAGSVNGAHEVSDVSEVSATPTASTPKTSAQETFAQEKSYDQIEAQLAQPHVIERQQALLREITTTLLITLALFIGLHYSAQAVPLDGPSMQPGLHTDERVLVNSLAYTFSGPQRGDVIVFHPPTALNERYIKRVIGLPGDTITLTANSVLVNGVALNEPYITPAPPGETENPEPQTIKLSGNQYFVMGDNRTNSQDSRYFGPITKKAIVGKAEFIVWPLSTLQPINTYPNVYGQVPSARPPLATPHTQRALLSIL